MSDKPTKFWVHHYMPTRWFPLFTTTQGVFPNYKVQNHRVLVSPLQRTKTTTFWSHPNLSENHPNLSENHPKFVWKSSKFVWKSSKFCLKIIQICLKIIQICLKIIQNYTHPLHPARRCDCHDHLRLPTHLRGHPRDLIAIARTTGQFDLAGPDFCSK